MSLEIVFGVFRLLLAVTALFWVWLGDVPLPEGWSSISVWLAVATFCLYTLLVYVYTRQRPELAGRIDSLTALIDTSFVTFTVILSPEGPTQSAFRLSYVAVVALHAFNFGLAFGILLGLVSGALYAVACVYHDKPIHHPWLQVGFPIALMLISAFCCGVLHWREHDRQRQALRSITSLEERIDKAERAAALVNQRVFELVSLCRLSPAAAMSGHISDILDAALEAACGVLGIDAYALLLVDEHVRRLRIVAWFGLPRRLPMTANPSADDGLCAEIMASAGPRQSVNAADEVAAIYGEAPPEVSGAMLCLPLNVRGAPAGILCVHRRSGERFRSPEVALLDSIVGQIALSMGSAAFFERVRPSAVTEPESGLLRREHFDERLPDDWKAAAQAGAPLSLVLLGVRGLMNLAAGEDGPRARLLHALGQAATQLCRQGDIAARFDEETVALLMNGTNANVAEHVGRRLRERAWQVVESNPEWKAAVQAIEVGVSGYPESASEPEELVSRARGALVRALQGQPGPEA